MTVTAAPTTPAPAGLGWRLGALYGPAIYGVSAAAVALPAAAAGLHATPSAAVWILTIHALGLGIGAAVAGRSTDTWGPRRVLTLGAALLAAGTILCATASALLVAVAGRAMIAAGSGTMTATALTLATNQPGPQRPIVLARLGAMMALYSATAPLAGALVTAASWRATLVLPALSLVALPLCWPLTRRRRVAGRVDGVGAALLVLVAVGLLLTIQSATLHIPQPAVIALLAGTCALGILLIVHSRRHPAGFLPAAVVGSRRFYLAGLVGAGVYGGLFACVYAVPQMLTRLGYSAQDVGLLLLPGAVAAALMARLAATAIRTLPPQRVLAGAAALFSATVLLAAVNQRPAVLACAATAGFAAFAIAQMTLTAAISAHTAPPARAGAVGLLNLIFFIGGALGPAGCAALWHPLGLPTALVATAALPAIAAAVAWRCRL
ncbi:MFS transporter [Micromonospora sp. WMMC250]|uniref:MFS transporter n=1 Tax=Micromonospora sp. WMMC250 TaxID=3014781 RepID=UPI0022B695D9|nr:MFS transporter [Micromonospora sp. WMMC250]MCZ7379705.1 MFS transporter [Micromonospora sp. WMMC250]